jgi:hypothetical protein
MQLNQDLGFKDDCEDEQEHVSERGLGCGLGRGGGGRTSPVPK